MIKKFLSLVLAATIAAGIMLAGCSAGGSGPQTLRLIYSGTPQTFEKEYVNNTYVKNFEEKNNVKVEIDYQTQADAVKKVGAEQESKNIVTDLILVDTAWVAAYVNGGWMEDITKPVNDTKSTQTPMFDGVTTSDGKRYFAPISFDVYLTIANKKALKYLPAGLTDRDIANGITWEQYAAWAKAIAAGEGVGKTMMPANLTGSQLLYPMGGMGLAYGAPSFPDLSSDGFKKAMGVIADMAAGNAFYPEQAQYTAPTDPLKNGAVWLTFAHMGPVGTAYKASPNDYIIGAAPRGPSGAGSTAGAWCFGIQKGSKNLKPAQKFIAYAMEPKTDYEYCVNMGGLLSPIKEVAPLLGSDDVIMAAGSRMLETTKITGVPSTQYTDWNAVKLVYGDLFNKILKDKAVPPDSYFDELQSKVDKLKK